MAEPEKITFRFSEVVEALLKREGIHEGIWGLYVEFGINAANVGPTMDDVHPAAIVPIVKLGLQKFEQEGSISVDAAKVNPAPPPMRAKKKK